MSCAYCTAVRMSRRSSGATKAKGAPFESTAGKARYRTASAFQHVPAVQSRNPRVPNGLILTRSFVTDGNEPPSAAAPERLQDSANARMVDRGSKCSPTQRPR